MRSAPSWARSATPSSPIRCWRPRRCCPSSTRPGGGLSAVEVTPGQAEHGRKGLAGAFLMPGEKRAPGRSLGAAWRLLELEAVTVEFEGKVVEAEQRQERDEPGSREQARQQQQRQAQPHAVSRRQRLDEESDADAQQRDGEYPMPGKPHAGPIAPERRP